MKKIIDIIKEANTEDIRIARYNKDMAAKLDTGIMDKMIPEIGEEVTDGNQTMKVVEYFIADDGIGVKFDKFPAIIAAEQLIEMLENGIIRVK